MAKWKITKWVGDRYIECEWCEYYQYISNDPDGQIVLHHESICKKQPSYPFNQINLIEDPFSEDLKHNYFSTWEKIPAQLSKDSWWITGINNDFKYGDSGIAWLKYEMLPAEFLNGRGMASDEYSSPWGFPLINGNYGITEKEWESGKMENSGFVELINNDGEVFKVIKNINIDKAIQLGIEWIKEVDPKYRETKEKEKLELKAKKLEKQLNYDEAIKIWDKIKKPEEAARVRKIVAELKKVDQTVVQGDQITKTEIKDSVLNRSNVGGGSSKMQELKDLTEMKEKGLIDDDEFNQMKKEILGK